MAVWFARQWQLLRELLAVTLFAAGLVATVVWIVFGTWFTMSEFARALLFIINWLR